MPDEPTDVRPSLEPTAARAHGWGLRAQIMVALGIGFALSVVLLGLATTRLGGAALDADRRQAAEGTAAALLVAARMDEASRREAMEAVLGSGGVVGVEILDGEGASRVGRFDGVSTVERRAGDLVVRLALVPSDSPTRRTLPRLLFLYVAITAAAILLLSYVLLTRLIVRPVEDLTRASERVARGADARAPIHGAAEIAQLALSFNGMQTQLAAERAALERRLRELEQTTAELETTQRSLVRSEKMASVGRLAAGIAHEIGNPLTSIAGLVELVEDGDLEPDEQREFLRRVRKETERIHRIIRDLLDFARGDGAGEVDADATCDLVEVVEDAVRLVGPQKDLRSVTLERRFAEDCPLAHGSAPRLAQVVLNLLLNAADAIDGDGTIRLEVHPTEDDRWVELVVQDTGPGIPEEVREHLFEPFVTTKPPGHGTGLGLAVCLALVEQTGGTLEASNAEEGGARFVVRLPLAG